MPKTLTSGNTKRCLFTGQDFIYDAEKDHYTCPAGQHLIRGQVRSDRSGEINQHLSSQAAVHRGESEAGQALDTRRRP